jgi:hypothetical protein
MKKEKYFGISPHIARWKNDTPFENWLSYRADSSEFFKRLYVLYYKHWNRKYYEGGLKMISQLIDERAELQELPRKPLINDMIYCLHRFGIPFNEYCWFGFKDKNTSSRKTYISDKLKYHYDQILNNEFVTALLTDKYRSYEAYREFYKRDVVACYTMEDKSKFLSFVKKNHLFIIKPIAECKGRGIEILSLEASQYETFFNQRIAQGAFIAEELIKQGKELAQFHPQSINTLRISTFVVGEEVSIYSAMLRIGKGLSQVDNVRSGGLCASVDIKTGIVQHSAKEYASNMTYNFHPDTHVQIVGFQLPQWDNLIATVTAIAKKVKGTTLIGWDMAYTDEGWIMVEGNSNGSLASSQMVYNVGFKPYLFAKMDKYFELEK